jgi:4-hydroxy-3-polyprenylbenzoate decarboxylase
VFFSEGPIDQLDHATNFANYGGKMGIDATTKLPGEQGYEREWPPVVEMDPAVKTDVAAKWTDLLGRLGGNR